LKISHNQSSRNKHDHQLFVKINKTEINKSRQFGLANELLNAWSKIVDGANIYAII